MRKEKFFALVMTAALMLGLAGCQGSIEAEAADTEKAANESRETVTAVGQAENEAAETVVQRVDISDFVYPNEPLTAENLLKITTAAKVTLCKSGETSGNMSLYRFGLLDVDFDGFPEMFCELCNGQHNHKCRLYSLKEDNFCEKLLEYNAYFEYDGSSVIFKGGNTAAGKT